jgi:uncharacterized cupredoxin-like copper-binding protein
VVAAAALALIASACGGAARADTVERTVTIHYSRFDPDVIEVPAGVPVTFTLKNQDPIDHEWIVGDAEVHERHRTGTEPSHTSRPTEVTVPALSTRVTTISFDSLGELQYICHLPAHEEYGMVGTLHVVPGTDAEGASG